MGVRLQQCLTREEIEETELDIYNDQPIRYYKKQEVEPELDIYKAEEFLSRVLLPEEQYRIVEEKPEYVYTSRGRLLNTKTFRQISATFAENRMHHVLNQFQLNGEKTFKRFGWEWDLDKIKNDYIQRKWKHGLVVPYKLKMGRNHL